jgi:hypothetical protein
MNLELVLTLITAKIGLVASTVTFWIKSVKNSVAKTRAENCSQIRDVLLGYIIEAEKLKNFSGAEKKQFVMMRVHNFATANKIIYDAERVGKRIDEIIALTQMVNCPSP